MMEHHYIQKEENDRKDELQLLIMFGEKEFKPPTYKIIAGTEIRGWWVFKREVEVWYVLSDIGMSLGPFYDHNEAVMVYMGLKG